MRLRHCYLLLAVCAGFFLCLSACYRINNSSPSDLKRTGFLFNYRIINDSPPPPRSSEVKIKRFDHASLSVFFPPSVILPTSVTDSYFRRSGVSVSAVYYPSNTEARKRIEAGGASDLVMVAGFLTAILTQEQLLAELSPERIANLDNVAPQFRDPGFDPGSRHSVPILWRSVGIAYNSRRLDLIPRSWKDLFAPDFARHPELAGRIGFVASPHRVFAAAQVYLGNDLNSRDPREIARASELLRSLGALNRYRVIPEADIAERLAKEDILLALTHSADVTAAMKHNPSISFAIPSDGSWVSFYALAIPARVSGLRREIAEDFVNFLLEPTVAAEIANESLEATTVEGASAYLEPEIRLGPSSLAPTEGWRTLVSLADDPSQLQTFQAFVDEAAAKAAHPQPK